jgi:hypothetical protein
MKKAVLASIISFLSLIYPSIASACTVCFGGASDNLQRGFYWGVVFLGALPFMMIAWFVSYIVYQSRKNKPR